MKIFFLQCILKIKVIEVDSFKSYNYDYRLLKIYILKTIYMLYIEKHNISR